MSPYTTPKAAKATTANLVERAGVTPAGTGTQSPGGDDLGSELLSVCIELVGIRSGLALDGLPFHMPTRLAAGLGLESDPRLAPFRPDSGLPDFGSPAPGNVSPDLGCGGEHPKNRGQCQTRGKRLKVWNQPRGNAQIFIGRVAGGINDGGCNED